MASAATDVSQKTDHRKTLAAILTVIEMTTAGNGILHAAFAELWTSDTEPKASNELLRTEMEELKKHTKKLTKELAEVKGQFAEAKTQ